MSIILILYLLGCLWYSACVVEAVGKELKNYGYGVTERLTVITLAFIPLTIFAPVVMVASLWVYITKR